MLPELAVQIVESFEGQTAILPQILAKASMTTGSRARCAIAAELLDDLSASPVLETTPYSESTGVLPVSGFSDSPRPPSLLSISFDNILVGDEVLDSQALSASQPITLPSETLDNWQHFIDQMDTFNSSLYQV
ncbi:hypothetical protein Sste5344_002631 [Sporothrix stenoceras]